MAHIRTQTAYLLHKLVIETLNGVDIKSVARVLFGTHNVFSQMLYSGKNHLNSGCMSICTNEFEKLLDICLCTKHQEGKHNALEKIIQLFQIVGFKYCEGEWLQLIYKKDFEQTLLMNTLFNDVILQIECLIGDLLKLNIRSDKLLSLILLLYNECDLICNNNISIDICEIIIDYCRGGLSQIIFDLKPKKMDVEQNNADIANNEKIEKIENIQNRSKWKRIQRMYNCQLYLTPITNANINNNHVFYSFSIARLKNGLFADSLKPLVVRPHNCNYCLIDCTSCNNVDKIHIKKELTDAFQIFKQRSHQRLKMNNNRSTVNFDKSFNIGDIDKNIFYIFVHELEDWGIDGSYNPNHVLDNYSKGFWYFCTLDETKEKMINPYCKKSVKTLLELQDIFELQSINMNNAIVSNDNTNCDCDYDWWYLNINEMKWGEIHVIVKI